jgi:hypothetical protein
VGNAAEHRWLDEAAPHRRRSSKFVSRKLGTIYPINPVRWKGLLD